MLGNMQPLSLPPSIVVVNINTSCGDDDVSGGGFKLVDAPCGHGGSSNANALALPGLIPRGVGGCVDSGVAGDINGGNVGDAGGAAGLPGLICPRAGLLGLICPRGVDGGGDSGVAGDINVSATHPFSLPGSMLALGIRVGRDSDTNNVGGGVVDGSFHGVPRLPPRKMSKYTDWTNKLRTLSEEDVVILNNKDPSGTILHQENCFIQCILCQDCKGKSNGGVINLRRPYNAQLWDQHATSSKHMENMQRHRRKIELCAQKNEPQLPQQRGLLAFNFTN